MEAEPDIGHQELLVTAERLAGFGTWSMPLSTRVAQWSDGMYRLFGVPEGEEPSVELLVRRIHPDDRERVVGALDRAWSDPEEIASRGMGLEYRVLRPDGTVREVRGRGRAVRHDSGWRWFGVERDVTDERMSERELLAHYSVTQALRDWESYEEGIVVLLRRMRTALDFPTAAMWTWDRQAGALVCRAVCSQPDLDASTWEAATKALTFRPGEGLPGRAWAMQQPVSSPDVVNDPGFRRSEAAAALGISSALLFPAISGRGPVAVLSFYSFERREPSARLLRTLTGIGTELGRFLDGRLGQLAPSPLSAREREVLQLASEALSGPQIAQRLVVSPSTIKTHFENIYEKLGVGDRAGAVAYALRLGIIS